MGVDRIKPELGYFKDNTVPCCPTCNYMKGNLSMEVFIHKCTLVAKHFAAIEASSAITSSSIVPTDIASTSLDSH